VNLNKSLVDELNQPTSFPTDHSNKKMKIQQSPKPNKTPQKTSGMGFLKKRVSEH